ncbi:MAG TPA: hypothetical protein VHM92_06600 [Allosphingosinicella sp.]|nr:hypothetical protein [Allosphingosinicella sp.]
MYVRVGQSSIGALDIATGTYQELARLSSRLSTTRIYLGGAPSPGMLAPQVARLEKLDVPSAREASRLWIELAADGAIAWGALDRLSLRIEGGGLPAYLSGLWVRGFRPYSGGSRDGPFLHHFMGLPGEGALATPVLDGGDNRLAGLLFPDHYRPHGEVNPAGFRIDAAGLSFIAASRWRDRLALLRLDDDLGLSLELRNGSAPAAQVKLCETHPALQFRHKPFDPSVREILHEVKGAGPGYSMRSLLYSTPRAKGTPRRLVLYFHGGPASTISDQPQPRMVTNLLSSSTDVLAVDYPGSAGLREPFIAFQNRGIAAIDDGMDSLRKWVAAQGYQTVHVVAESFGSVPALALRRRAPAFAASYFLVAPMLRVPPLSSSVRAAGIASEGQEVFEAQVFGAGPKRQFFEKSLLALAKRQPRGKNVTIFIGGKDIISPSSHLADLNPGAVGEVVAIPGATHQRISVQEQVLETIDRRINGVSPKR